MAKKNDKSSKTAHVLNLITSPAEKAAAKSNAAVDSAEPQEQAVRNEQSPEAAEAGVVNQQAAQVQQPLIPPILQVAHRHDETLAEQIRDALSEELADLQEPAAPKPQPAPQPQPAPAPAQPEPEQAPPQPEPAAQPVVAPEPVPQPAPEPVPAPEPEPVAQPAPAPQPQPEFKLPASAIMSTFTMPDPPPLPPLEEDLNFVNVMQMLVESMAPRYIERFGVCSCPRCLEDVKALALTNLGPKYTVFRASERVPMLTVYEKRYASQVAAELTKACAIVKANPRHR